jgi:hypothetical protein
VTVPAVAEVQHEVAPAGTAAHSPLAVPQPRRGAVERLRNFTNRSMAVSAYRLRRLGTTGVAGIVLLVASVSVFLASNLPQTQLIATLQAQVGQPSAFSVPAPVTIDGTALTALPARADALGILNKVVLEAKAAGIELERGQYEFVSARDGVAARYRMTFPVHTSYVNLRQFMDQTLIALPAVAVEALRVERKSVGDDSVDAELRLSAYVRSDE